MLYIFREVILRCEKIDLWNEEHLKGNKFQKVEPYMETYFLKGDNKRPCILICPGGGYEKLSEREAEPVAVRFNAEGFHAAVLYYSVSPNIHPQPLYDVARAVSILRENAWDWNIEEIAVCGFSAGGHLSASLGVYSDIFKKQEVYGINKTFTKPDALILSYPVICFDDYVHKSTIQNLLGKEPNPEIREMMSLQNHVTKSNPPVFLWHTLQDESVPVENSLIFADSLRKNAVPFELHIFPEGGHGMSLAVKETAEKKGHINSHTARWLKLCVEWLKNLFN